MAGVDADLLLFHSIEDRIKGMLESGMSADKIFRGLKGIGFSGNKRKFMAFLENNGLWTRRSHPRSSKSMAGADDAFVSGQLRAGIKTRRERSSRYGNRTSWKARKPRKCVARRFNRKHGSPFHCKGKRNFSGLMEMFAKIERQLKSLEKVMGAVS